MSLLSSHAVRSWPNRIALGRLVGCRDVVEGDRVAGDVLAGVVQVYIEVLEAALVRVAVAQADARGVVLQDRCRCRLRLPEEVQQMPQVLDLLDAVGQCEVLRLGG